MPLPHRGPRLGPILPASLTSYGPGMGPVSHSRAALLLPLPQLLPGFCLTSALPALSSQLDGPAPPPPLPGQDPQPPLLGKPFHGLPCSLSRPPLCPGPAPSPAWGVCELDGPFSASLKCLEGKNHSGSISEVTIRPDTKQVLRNIHPFISVIRVRPKQSLSPVMCWARQGIKQ